MAWHMTSSTERGYGAAWRRLRRLALARDLGLCASCLRQGRTIAAVCVDHIRPRAQDGSDDLDNLQSLCGPCHDAKSTLEDGRRVRPVIGLDGWPVADAGRYVGPLWRQGRAGWAD